MEYIIKLLYEHLPETICNILVVACVVLYFVITWKVGKNGTMLKTVVKESNESNKAAVSAAASNFETIVKSTETAFNALVNDSAEKTKKDYDAIYKENQELKKQVIRNDEAFAKILAQNEQILNTMRLVSAQNILQANANKLMAEATVTDMNLSEKLKTMYNTVIGVEKPISEMYTSMRGLEKIAFSEAENSVKETE